MTRAARMQKFVEMAGVEPASKNTYSLATTRLFPELDLALPRPKGSGDASASNDKFQVFSSLPRFNPIPVCDSDATPPGVEADPRVALKLGSHCYRCSIYSFSTFLTSAHG